MRKHRANVLVTNLYTIFFTDNLFVFVFVFFLMREECLYNTIQYSALNPFTFYYYYTHKHIHLYIITQAHIEKDMQLRYKRLYTVEAYSPEGTN